MRVVVIDDNPEDRRLVIRELEREFENPQVVEIANQEALNQAFRSTKAIDLVITDYQLGWADGLSVLQQVKATLPACPVIMFTGSGDEETAVAGMKSGLDDYVLKSRGGYRRLMVAVRSVLEKVNLRQQALNLEKQRAEALAQALAAQQEAERASRLKDEFLAVLSHELRTPLNLIVGYAQVALRQSLDPISRQALEVIERNARLQFKLIGDLIDVSRLSVGIVRLERRSLELSGVVESVVDALRSRAEAKGLHLLWKRPLYSCPVWADPDRLTQVVSNLLSNAIKFTGEGGRIELTLERSGSTIDLRVSDSGIGISADFLPYVFERFRRAAGTASAADGSLGIGLYVVHDLVTLHGGTVTAHSDGLGQGATFTVRLPLLTVQPGPN